MSAASNVANPDSVTKNVNTKDIEALRKQAQGTLISKFQAGTLVPNTNQEGGGKGVAQDAKNISDSPESRHMAEEMFKIIDTDNSGGIEFTEMQTACRLLSEALPEYFPSDTTAESLMLPDRNKDGVVDMGEWLDFMNMVHQAIGQAKFVQLVCAASSLLRTALGKPLLAADVTKLSEEYFETYSASVEGAKVIRKDTFPIVISAMGMDKSKEQLEEMWRSSGETGDTMAYDAFSLVVAKNYKPKEQCEKVAQLYEAFSLFDLNGDGVVTLDEMRSVMMECGSTPLSEEEWKTYEDFFKRADVNQNGKLTVSEYIKASLADIS